MSNAKRVGGMALRAHFACFCLLALAGTAQAQNIVGDLKVQTSSKTGLASFVSAADGGAIAVQTPAGRAAPTPMDFMLEHGALFGVTDPFNQLTEHKVESDSIGFTHTTYRQMHQGVHVFGGTLKVHQDAAGQVKSANGDFFPLKPTFPIVPAQSNSEAERTAAAIIEGSADVELSELVIVDPGWYGDVPLGPRLAYHVVLRDPDAVIREAFLVDAQDGQVIDQWSMIHTARNRKIHDTAAGSNCCLNLTPSLGCEDEACMDSVCDFDPFCCKGEWDGTCAYWAYLFCGTMCDLPGPLVRTEGAPAIVGSDDVNRAYDYYGDTYDYYFRAFGRDGIDGRGMAMVATVNSQLPGCPNAFWNGQQMVFCPGTVTDDIVGHELTHGVTEFSAGLIYQNQPGQLNEAYSDIFGEVIDLFNSDAAFVGTTGVPPLWPSHPTPADLEPGETHLRRSGCVCPQGLNCNTLYVASPDARWLVAEDASSFGGAIRDMWCPTCFAHPDRAYSACQSCGFGFGFDNGGVHFGSSVPNHAFAIITDGDTFNNYTVLGIGPVKSGAIWYRALAEYLTELSDFEDAYVALKQAAADLVGTAPNDPRTGQASTTPITAADIAELDKALKATEMNGPGACGTEVNIIKTAAPDVCGGNAGTIFFEDFESGADDWSVGFIKDTQATYDPTVYYWVLKSALPQGRTGKAMYCADSAIGDCFEQYEAAAHTLVSPLITLPSSMTRPTLSFKHYMKSEIGFDGGLVQIKVGATAEKSPITADYLYNEVNTFLYRTLPAAPGDPPIPRNPLETRRAWSGTGGWGTTVIDLSTNGSFDLQGGEAIQLFFKFGKDGCGGADGWYVDDVRIFNCDCNSNGHADDDDIASGTSNDCNSNGIPDECDGGCAPSGGGGGGGGDTCPDDAAKTAPGLCGCGKADTDNDADGTPDCLDLCPNDTTVKKTNPGICGCGVADTDSDGDAVPDCNDKCPNAKDQDSDGDGLLDCNELCPFDKDKSDPGSCGCGEREADDDGDGTPDCRDLCLGDADKASPGVCGCGVAESDGDGDGVPDCIDQTAGGQPQALVIDGPAQVLVGATAKFTANIQYTDGSLDDVSGRVSWKVMDTVLSGGGLFAGDTVGSDGTLTVSADRDEETTLAVTADFVEGTSKLEASHLVAVVMPEVESPQDPPIVDGGNDNTTGGGQGTGTTGARGGGLCAIGLIPPMTFAVLVLGVVKRSRRK